jgi:quinol monooxygenase YgiN
VRARAIGIYQVFTFGALALGATLGGMAGEAMGLSWALGVAGTACMVCAALVRHLSIDPVTATGATTAWLATPPPVPQPEPADTELETLLRRGGTGRVLEVVRYRIDPADRAAFLRAMAETRQVRLRSGALGWRLYEDVAHPERWVELWEVEDWTAHLREAGRMTEGDQALLARAAALHRSENPPEAARYLNVQPPGG